MKEYSVINHPLTIKNVEKGIILPRQSKPMGGNWGDGGVCDENNNFVIESVYDGGYAKHGGKYTWSNEVVIHETVVYFGLFFPHWGHFIIDLISRMWVYPHICKNIKLAYIGESEISDNYLEFFNLLGINKNDLIHVKQPTRFNKVIVPEQGFIPCQAYAPEWIKMIDSAVECTLEKKNNVQPFYGNKIYFTRKRFQDAKIKEFGEKYFEDLYKTNNYTIVAPEELTLSQQILIWNTAQEIVCINGSIPITSLFCKNSHLKLIVLNKTSLLHENPMIFFQIRNLNPIFLNIFKEPIKGFPKYLGVGPFLLIPQNDFSEFNNKNGIIKPHNIFINNLYWIRQYISYFIALSGIKNRIKITLYKLVPKSFKRIIKKSAQ